MSEAEYTVGPGWVQLPASSGGVRSRPGPLVQSWCLCSWLAATRGRLGRYAPREPHLDASRPAVSLSPGPRAPAKQSDRRHRGRTWGGGGGTCHECRKSNATKGPLFISESCQARPRAAWDTFLLDLPFFVFPLSLGLRRGRSPSGPRLRAGSAPRRAQAQLPPRLPPAGVRQLEGSVCLDASPPLGMSCATWIQKAQSCDIGDLQATPAAGGRVSCAQR